MNDMHECFWRKKRYQSAALGACYGLLAQRNQNTSHPLLHEFQFMTHERTSDPYDYKRCSWDGEAKLMMLETPVCSDFSGRRNARDTESSRQSSKPCTLKDRELSLYKKTFRLWGVFLMPHGSGISMSGEYEIRPSSIPMILALLPVSTTPRSC